MGMATQVGDAGASHFDTGGNIAGTATFAYATGAGVTRVGAFAAGFAPTATYVAGTGTQSNTNQRTIHPIDGNASGR